VQQYSVRWKGFFFTPELSTFCSSSDHVKGFLYVSTPLLLLKLTDGWLWRLFVRQIYRNEPWLIDVVFRWDRMLVWSVVGVFWIYIYIYGSVVSLASVVGCVLFLDVGGRVVVYFHSIYILLGLSFIRIFLLEKKIRISHIL